MFHMNRLREWVRRIGLGLSLWTLFIVSAFLMVKSSSDQLLAPLQGTNPDIGNVHNITPLMYSARYGNEEVCKLLIDYGAGLNLQDVYGETALMVAARTGHPKMAKLLITAGAEMGIRNRQAQSALDLAHLCKQGAIAKMLRRSANKPLAH